MPDWAVHDWRILPPVLDDRPMAPVKAGRQTVRKGPTMTHETTARPRGVLPTWASVAILVITTIALMGTLIGWATTLGAILLNGNLLVVCGLAMLYCLTDKYEWSDDERILIGSIGSLAVIVGTLLWLLGRYLLC